MSGQCLLQSLFVYKTVGLSADTAHG